MVTTAKPDPKLTHCPALVGIKAISGKWKTRILWLLRDRPHHFGEIRTLLPGVSAKVLSQQLSQLGKDGLVLPQEEMRGGVVFMIYDYTDYGRTLVPVLDLLGAWGDGHERRQGL
ncbi:MAG: helix-turn-helix transcriptional regulator [Tabrizicola sp.]|nr:helix-turn-helix transcriptional regulator [Tabrizicola sp.]